MVTFSYGWPHRCKCVWNIDFHVVFFLTNTVRNVFANVYTLVTQCDNTCVSEPWESFIVDCSLNNPRVHRTTIFVHDFPSPGFASCVNKRHLLVNYLHDVKDILQVYELSTGQLVRDLPLKVGTVCGVSCKKKHSEFFYKFTSFTTPGRSRMNIPDRFSTPGIKSFFYLPWRIFFFFFWFRILVQVV